jgi:hypothetical protein
MVLPPFLQANTGIYTKFSHDHFLSLPLQFIIHRSPYSALYRPTKSQRFLKFHYNIPTFFLPVGGSGISLTDYYYLLGYDAV